MAATPVRTAVAVAPGHVTGVFRTDARARDPRARGSVGAGVVLELGARATARFRTGGARRLRVSDEDGRSLPISRDVARRLFRSTEGTLTVELAHDLPVGQGFGMSAAGATATALAVASLFRIPRAHAIEVAHLADLYGGGGLGGVAAILGGGLEVRRRPGVPPFGNVVHRPFGPDLLVGTVGPPIPSPDVLGSSKLLRRIDAAHRVWEELGDRPTPEELLAASERFTDRVRLAPARLSGVLRGLRRRGAWAAQAMFGSTFFAMPQGPVERTAVVEWLQGRGLRAVELGAATRGPTTVSARSRRGSAAQRF